jgi:hypothetical protein
MKTEMVVYLSPEKEVTNEYFNASFVRQLDGRLLAHVKYTKWSAEAKKKTKEIMDSFDEPLYIFIHDTYHLKYVSALGFVPTGRLVTCPFPGKERQLFGEAIYIKEGLENYCLRSYEEEGATFLPLEYLDGWGSVQKLEEALFKLPKAKWTTKHYFSDGVYTRETYIPKGTLLTGYRHKQETVSILVKGVISVVVSDTEGRAESKGVLVAPLVFVTKPGLKKIGLAHEDTVFINSFPLAGIPEEFHNEENIMAIENYIFDKEDTLCLE